MATTRKGMSAAERKKDQIITAQRKKDKGAGKRVVPAKDRGVSAKGSKYSDPTSVGVEVALKKPKTTGAMKMETESPAAKYDSSPIKKYSGSPMKKYGNSPMKKNASPFAKLGSKEVDSPTTFKGDAASAIKKYIGKQ